MIKSSVKKAETREYPRLMCSTNGNVYIMFSMKEGLRIALGDSVKDKGVKNFMFHDKYSGYDFVDFKGSVTLTQD